MKIKWLLPALLIFFSQFLYAGAPAAPPDFRIRGFHLDLRIQVMKMPALRDFARKLKQQGINTLIMEWEASFPFQDDPLIPNRYAYSRQEIKDFVSYCKTLGIDVIPLQQSFGHVDYILRNNKYAALREDEKDFSQVCPSEEALNRELFTRLFKDMMSLHPSPYFHIGGDETRLLGHCEKCKKRAAEIGLSRIYFDHIKMLCDIVVSLGKIPVLWADIALHYPEYLNLLPKQAILVDWNYGWKQDYFGNHEKLVKSGYEIWGAPSLRSSPDNYFLTRWAYHFGNIRDFLPACKDFGYKGIIMTSWSTSGVYTPVYESEDDLVDLTALRHVYPISGFDLLLSAYTKALDSASLDVDRFIADYCNTRFGFSGEETKLFQKALFTAPYTVSNGKVNGKDAISVKSLLDSAETAGRIFTSLHPKTNPALFGQYRLMNDIRIYYLRYLDIEDDVNADSVSEKNIPVFIARLKKLMEWEPVLNRRFTEMNQSLLYPAAIEEENQLRNQKIHLLFDRLSRNR